MKKKRKVNSEILLKGDLHKEVGPMLFLFFFTVRRENRTIRFKEYNE